MTQKAGRLVLVVCAIFVVGVAPLAATQGPQIEVETKVAVGDGWNVEVLEVDTWARPGPELILRLENDGIGFLRAVQLAVTLQQADGLVRSYVQYVVAADLDPGESRYVTRTLPFPAFREGDRILVAPELLAPQSSQGRVFEKNGPAQCSTYCDRCADKAAALCSHGVETYSCSCKEGSYVCTFDCHIPSV